MQRGGEMPKPPILDVEPDPPVKYESELQTEIKYAFKKQDVDAISGYIEEFILNERTRYPNKQTSALVVDFIQRNHLYTIATRTGNFNAIVYLMDKYNINVNTQFVYPTDRLTIYALDHTDIVLYNGQTLLDFTLVSATPNSYTLYHAYIKGNREVIQKLIEHGENINMANSAGLTALHYAAYQCGTEIDGREQENRLDCVSLLLDRGASYHENIDECYKIGIKNALARRISNKRLENL
jgi:hypothetical protein